MCSLQCSNRVSYQSHKTIARYTYSGQEGGGAVRLLFWGERKLDNHQTESDSDSVSVGRT